LSAKDYHSGHHFSGPVMESHPGALRERPGSAFQQIEPHIYHRGCMKTAGGSEHASARNLFDIQALKVHRRALPGESRFRVAAVDLKIADAASHAAGEDFHL